MHWTIYSFFTDIATIRRQREMALPLPRKREAPVTKVKLLRSRMIRKRSRPVLKPSEGGDPFAQVNPKKSGKLRPLGLPSWSSKVMQEAVRQLLDAYFEPTFSDHSHGFRKGAWVSYHPERNCPWVEGRPLVHRGGYLRLFWELVA